MLFKGSQSARLLPSVAALLCLGLGLLSGCAAKGPPIVTILPENTPTQTAQPTLSATAVLPTTPTTPPTRAVPSRTPVARVTSTSQPVATASPNPVVRPVGGWSIFSNPDFVQDMAFYDGQLWTATLGGVAVWDLKSDQPTLFTTRNGLAEIQGNAIVYCAYPEDQIIVAHHTGVLSKYSLANKKWSRVAITFSDGSGLSQVQSLLCDAPNHRLLVGSPAGLGILDFDTNQWQQIGAAQGLKVDEIRSIAVIGRTIWVAAGAQSALMIQGSSIFPFKNISGFPSEPINDLAIAPDRSVWLAYPTTLVHYFDRKWNSYGTQMPSGIPFTSVDQVEVGPDNRIWIASAESGVCPFELATLACENIYPARFNEPITDLLVDAQGVGYAATAGNGIMVMDHEQVRQLVFDRQQLLSNAVTSLAESTDGKLWVATDQGVNILDPARPVDAWQSLTPARGKLAHLLVSGLQPAPGGMWFFYKDQPQASFFDGQNWLHLDEFKGISGPVLASAVDAQGHLWIASTHALNVWDGTAMHSYGPESGPPGTLFQALFADADSIWVGTDRGLLRYQNFQWQTVLPDLPIRAIVANPSGGLLLGTADGLVRFDGQQSFLWIINLGDRLMINPIVTSLTYDHSGHLWVGTAGDGLLYYDGQHWEHFDTADGLPANTIQKVYIDHLGAIWIAAGTGDRGGALVHFMP